MDKLTKKQAIVISGYTEILMCDFGDFHEDVEKRLGRPVMTHEFPVIAEEIKKAYKHDFLAMCPAEE